ncbi:MAG: hypothetical protein HN472_09840 [Nitrospina sp.]|jgi:hypothetical protein|nr:hypothetical protein [Nitrospina sp.]MBT3509828.1 hypothetical protein [Nitrospina sp.]MBT3876196.1 hypothetical protein [Nitrospina sp.]MBT4047335.1 hypothetical protein [Nitrospina sp.]MBT4558692.1 hypothetical protein [Nitrospina sp.]
MPSYSYELPEQGRLLSLVRENLNKVGEEWKEVADFMLEGHVEYKPMRANPMKSGFVYQRAKLNLTLYFPERIFEHLLDWLDSGKLELLKAVVQSSLPRRSGYDIHEFKILGIIEG